METISSPLHVRRHDDSMIGAPCSKRIKVNTTKDVPDDTKTFLKKLAFKNLLQEKKLSLVLDLDQTLLHSIKLSHLTPKDRDLILKETNDPKKNHKRKLFPVSFFDKPCFVTKLRPGLTKFLEEASKMFELHVFTMGSEDYAMEMIKLIDPGNRYFGCKSSSSLSRSRVLTKESCVENMKSLDLVIGKESGILIIDDKEKVWRDVDKENVLEIPQYDFFGLDRGRKLSQVLEQGRDESETEGWLIKYLEILKYIYIMFFFDPKEEGNFPERDVRVMKKILFKTVMGSN